ncbi:PQQ-dependent sugar dehydrogenase [Wenzhouxiangella sp. AB-CW3]|uniref:PQQ-dependent sugar dehydrogenase n=1 Tax=Wenzhouxiangella sp. AB-CW3 TaxID=2771012 RepID=UPI001CC2DF93|nr:PQQ-dependent sugar dehydrogenase [Wenzhouxiangella sp. AB-CW3]
MKLPRLSLALLFFLLSAASTADDLQIESIASGLEHPWSIAFLPDGRMLVTERAGRLRVIDADGQQLDNAISGVPEARVADQGGLMEVKLHPNFERNGWIYLSLAFTEPQGDGSAGTTRVVRGRIDGKHWVDNQIIFDAAPWRTQTVHYGGRMTFLDDHSLLISVGDGFDHREQAQKLDNHIGTIVRVHDDGRVPSDNPFVGKHCRQQNEEAWGEIFSYGHRNPQGLVFDVETGLIWSHEHGPSGGDELNLIKPGKNYGWPLATHGIDYSGARISPWKTRPDMVDPMIVWTPAIAPAGMSQYRGEMFPEWEGDLLIAGLVSRAIHRVRIDGETAEEVEILLDHLDRRLRDVQVGPDGALYVLTDEKKGEVLRVIP